MFLVSLLKTFKRIKRELQWSTLIKQLLESDNNNNNNKFIHSCDID